MGELFLAYGILNVVIALAVVAHHDYTEWKNKRDPKEYYNEELGDRPMTEREMDLVDGMNDYYDKLRDEQ